jgi:hypothetical protein
MAVLINASTSTGLVQSADTSGQINIQSNGTTVLGVTSTGTSVTGTQSVSGNLSFNSGYGSSAVAYGCRAWVSFNGTGTPAIRGNGNVSSITDNGTGDYTVNFTTAMPDANYAALAATGNDSGGFAEIVINIKNRGVDSVRLENVRNNAVIDATYVDVSIFR